MNIGVYKIVNIINGKIYIGSSINLKKRLSHHRSSLKNNKHKNSHLQRAYNKDGEESFVYEIIEYCDVDNCLIREQYWIDYYKSYNRSFGYNINPDATGLLVPCQEVRDKRSIAMKAIWQTEEFRRKVCGRDPWNKGLEMGKAPWNKGKKLSEEHINKLKNAKRVFTEEGKAKKKNKLRPKLPKIDVFDLNGNYINTFNSAIELQEMSEISEVLPVKGRFKSSHKGKPIYYIDRFHVNQCCNGKIKSYKGLIFKYKENGRSIE